ncbi:MAG: FG-GAP-like repeat-containing protein, partial [Candidatus Fermentibacter sp.]|nr:FG-GAP-like repeat-containing protein [Candidatus Fermentibacter sp.]
TTAQTGDLDGDGDWDLVLGCESGEVLYSENTGSDGEPRFTSSILLWCEEGPVDVFTRYAGCGRARPTVCDYDSDGTNDLLVGCHAGWIYVFRGLPADEDTADGAQAEGMLAVRGPFTRGVLRYFLALPAGECADLALSDRAGRTLALLPAQPGGSGSLEVPGGAEEICFLSASRDGGSCSRRLLVL